MRCGAIPRRQTTFRSDFAALGDYSTEVGAPGGIEAAAGSMYVTVPVRFIPAASVPNPRPRMGEVVVRRVNDVPGSTEGAASLAYRAHRCGDDAEVATTVWRFRPPRRNAGARWKPTGLRPSPDADAHQCTAVRRIVPIVRRLATLPTAASLPPSIKHRACRNEKRGPKAPFPLRHATADQRRSAALASRAARNSESWLQFGQRSELARSRPSE